MYTFGKLWGPHPLYKGGSYSRKHGVYSVLLLSIFVLIKVVFYNNNTRSGCFKSTENYGFVISFTACYKPPRQVNILQVQKPWTKLHF